MGSRKLFGYLELDVLEKDRVKLAGLRDTRDDSLIKYALGLPPEVETTLNMAGTVKDFFTSFGANISRGSKVSYNWTEKYTTPPPKIPVEEVKKIDKQIEVDAGVPFSNRSLTLFTDTPIEPEKVNVAISTVGRGEKLSPAITLSSSKNNWLQEWTISNYIETLPVRFEGIDRLDILLVERPDTGFHFLSDVSDRVSNIRILTSDVMMNEIRNTVPPLNNVEVNPMLPLDYFSNPKLGIKKMIIVGKNEYHVQKGIGDDVYEDTYSSDPARVIEAQRIFDNTWSGY